MPLNWRIAFRSYHVPQEFVRAYALTDSVRKEFQRP